MATHYVQITFLALLACGLCGAEAPLHLKTRALAAARQEGENATAPPKRLAYSRYHILVQFREAPLAEKLEELGRRGARILDYIPDYGFMLSVDDATTLEGLDLARVERLRPQDKVSPLLVKREARAPELEEAAGSQAFVVEFHRDVYAHVARQVVRQSGLATREHMDLLPNQLLVEGTPEDAARLAEWDEVAYVFPASRELKEGQRVYACPGAATLYGQAGQYTAQYGDGWDGPGQGSAQLGYFLGSLASALPRPQAQTELLRGVAEWGKYVAVTFAPASAPNLARTISILFASRSHGDAYPFDGPGKVLAHTFYPSPPNPEPIAGDMHFDDDENWGIGGQGVDVFSVALHEAGHALGLGHSDLPGSVMYPYYQRVTALTADDIAAIRELYATAGTTPPVQPPQPPAPPVAPTLAITSPTSGPSYTSTVTPVTLAGTADHPNGIGWVTWVNARGGSGTATGTRTWVAGPVSLQAGQNTIAVTAQAVGGASASRSLTVIYSPPTTKDTVAPSLSILSPAITSVATSASSVVVSGKASDNVAVVEVTWTDSIGRTGVAQGTNSWTAGPISLRIGTNVITIRARDAAGNTAWRSVVFTRR